MLRFNLKPLIEVIETTDEWRDREKYWIAYFRKQGAPLTNLTDGGEGTFGFHQSSIVRERHSIARRRYFSDPEARKKHSELFNGHLISEETKRKIAQSKTGQKHSEETKRKISLAGMGRSPSLETREKLRLANTGFHHSPESRNKMSRAAKARGMTLRQLENLELGRGKKHSDPIIKHDGIVAVWDASGLQISDQENKNAGS